MTVVQPTLPGITLTAPAAKPRRDVPPARPQPTHRRTDMETARAAGREAADPENLTRNQIRVLTAIVYAAGAGLTDFEHHPINRLQQTSAGKRRLELQRAGLVEEATHRRPSPSGKPVAVWTATDAGVALWRRLRAEGKTR